MTRSGTAAPTCADADPDLSVAEAAPRRPGPSRILIALIRGYQSARSGRPTGCRFIPSCSEYAVEAIDVHGPARGAALSARRIARCTPWGGHGVDPVPDRRVP